MFLYATNRNSDSVSGWAIQANGSLTPVPGSPYIIGSATSPASVATTPAGQCCYLYARTQQRQRPASVSVRVPRNDGRADATARLAVLRRPERLLTSSLQVNTTGELLYMANAGTSNITTFDIAAGAGTLTQRTGSPTSALNAPATSISRAFRRRCSWFRISAISSDCSATIRRRSCPPGWTSRPCSPATIAVWPPTRTANFAYVPKSDGVSDYLFGFRIAIGGSSLEELPLNPVSPTHTYTLSAQMPRTMVIRYSRRDREVLQVPE